MQRDDTVGYGYVLHLIFDGA